MLRAYHEVYLDQVVEEQGRFFEGLQDDDAEIDAVDFLTTYMHSFTRKQLDDGQAWYLTLDAGRLKSVFLQESGYVPKKGKSLLGFMPKWIGEFYAYAQWYWNVPSAVLCDKLSLETMQIVYPGAHDQDLKVAVEKLGRPIFA